MSSRERRRECWCVQGNKVVDMLVDRVIRLLNDERETGCARLASSRILASS